MKDKEKAIKEYLFESILNVSIEYGKEFFKEETKALVTDAVIKQGSNVLIDYIGSAIPGIGGAITSYRTNKKIDNIKGMMKCLNEKNQEMTNKFNLQSEENKEILDSIFEAFLEKIESTSQSEKIKFMISGYLKMLDLENPSFDVAYLYLDTLDKLTILDISVLKLAYSVSTIGEVSGYKDYEEILDAFDINYDQYEAVRQNLYRLGLTENDFDNKIDTDLKNIKIAIDELRDTTKRIVESITGSRSVKIKKLSSKSDIKLKAKDRLKISQFGRDFTKYFILENG